MVSEKARARARLELRRLLLGPTVPAHWWREFSNMLDGGAWGVLWDGRS